jgi:NitT/TauT family transport system substrate-binding protein
MIKHRIGTAAIGVSVGVSVLASCAAPAAPPVAAPAGTVASVPVTPAATDAPAAELTPVQFGYVPVAINAPVYVAAEKGYFADEGLTLEFLPIDGGSDAVVQVAAGNFDVAGGGISASMLNAVARGIGFEIAAPLHTERPKLASPFVVSKKRFDSGELTKVGDLKGKKVATNNRGTATEWWLASALKQGGVDITEVEVIGLPFPQVVPALESGTLDGAILTEPFATAAEDQGLIVRLTEDFISDFKPTYVYFNKEWVTANPELATKFVKAYLRGARDLQGEAYFDAANVDAIAKYTKVDPDVIKRARRPYFDPNGDIPLQDIQTLQEFYRKQGLLNYDADIDMAQYVVPRYVEAAVKELGGKVEFE